MFYPTCRWAGYLIPALLLATPCSAANTTVELDIITPLANGRYRVNPNRGLGVVIAVQNEPIAGPHKWRFDWTVSSTTPGLFADTGSIGVPQSFYQPGYPLQQNPFVGLSHFPIYSTDKPDKPMLAGEYIFEWVFSIGPWCEFDADQSRTYSFGWPISNGSFRLTVAYDADWPDVQPTTTCASAAGQVSFGPTTQFVDTVSPTTLPCVETATVTEKADPCQAVVGQVAAANISRIMTWSGAPLWFIIRGDSHRSSKPWSPVIVVGLYIGVGASCGSFLDNIAQQGFVSLYHEDGDIHEALRLLRSYFSDL
ncbi:hypothetical protein QBC47DRAFT_438218 [Echria macrotheca]|uniref:DUF7136 domain-containing protein n=1 Tax=Echria macrotheca TaxID=438768 RepID=A0AAJ0F982_9PEZI|nr:hypothetical protein QBC47DRAFT_438218 [Echria macrotheca]